jgi:hypothetical protein
VRARLLAIFMLITQGALAAGSVVWGMVASRATVETALLAAGLATCATAALGLLARFPDQIADLTPWNHWRMPAIGPSATGALDGGPVLVTVEYHVGADDVDGFLQAIRRYGRVRRRDGASRWGIFRDLEHPDVYLESFLVASWAEHLRQHARLTRADSAVEREVLAHSRGEPKIRHLIYAQPDE